MSLAQKAAKGALWTIITSIGGRAVGVIGTLIITRFLAPEQIGEVSVATVIAQTANWASTWGFGPYAVVKAKGDEEREVMWHVTLGYIVIGILALGLVSLLRTPLAAWLNSPAAAVFVPGMALSVILRRVSSSAERVLVRAMRFREIGIAVALGEIVYTLTAVGLAARGWGGNAIIIGNIVQGALTSLLIVRAAGVRSWATPTPLSTARMRDMWQFGWPLGMETVAHNASRYWDNVLVYQLFGKAATGTYNMAYNLADVPAIQVGEQVASVLLPSMTQLEPARRPQALERATALLSLLIFPMAVGLGLVATPLIALILPSDKWQDVAPLLAILAGLSIFRPVTWLLSMYMDAQHKTKHVMVLEVAKVLILLLGMWWLSRYGIKVAAMAVGVAFALCAVAGIAMVVGDGVSAKVMTLAFVQPLLACVVMGAAVFAVRYGLGTEAMHPGAQLALESVVGALVYPVAALVLARKTARDFLGLGRSALKR